MKSAMLGVCPTGRWGETNGAEASEHHRKSESTGHL